jgi:hypothetical protein
MKGREDRQINPRLPDLRSEHMRGNAADRRVHDSIAYTAVPRFGNKPSRWKRLFVVAAAAVVVGGAALMLSHQFGPPSKLATKTEITSRVQSQNIVFVSDRDRDIQATEAVRAALNRGEIPESVANLSERMRHELLSGDRSLYRIPPAAQRESENAAAVRILVDDVRFQDVVLSKMPTYFTIPLKRGIPTRVTYLVIADSGGKGVAFRVTSITGELLTRRMVVGESISQTVALK